MFGRARAFWDGLWDLFFGGLFVVTPVIGPAFVLGDLAGAAISAVAGVIVVGGLSAQGAALLSVGSPKDSVIAHEAAIKADEFLVMAHGGAAEPSRAKAVLGSASA